MPTVKLTPAPRDLVESGQRHDLGIQTRKNVKFHDGSPFTADDVLFTFKRIPNVPNSPSSFATFTKPIVEAKATDPHTLILKTASPHVLLPSDLSSRASFRKQAGEKANTEDYNSGKGWPLAPLQIRRIHCPTSAWC